MKYLWLIIPLITFFGVSYVWYEVATPLFVVHEWIEMPTYFGLLMLLIASFMFAIDRFSK